jgi:alcohol dehydrogenase (cytochrome c)
MEKRNVLMTILLASIIPLSSFSLIGVNAQSGEINWNTNGNYGLNWDYVNQSQLSSTSAVNLNLAWVFPVASAPAPYNGHEGVCCSPVVENGIAYMLTNYHHVYAVNVGTGAIIWQAQLNVTTGNYALNPSSVAGHYHNANLFYSTHTLGRALIWIVSDNYTIFALDALTGAVVLTFAPDLSHMPGNFGFYDSLTPNAMLDDQDGILIIGTSVSEGTDAGRGYFLAYNVNNNPPTLLWETPIIPPQDGSDPNWAIESVQSMQHAWIFNGSGAVDLKSLPSSTLQSVLGDDWGFDKSFNGTRSFAGSGVGWGGPWAFDASTGIAYLSTAQASPDWNATFRPGPDLWSDSVLAVNIHTGQIIWAFQTTAHDLQDYDCAWSVILVQNTVVKGCKNGLIYGLDAGTGALKWFFNPPTIARDSAPFLNPLSSSDMTKPYACYPAAPPCLQNPPATGGIEADPAYNPQTGLVYYGTYNLPNCANITNVAPTPGAQYGGSGRAGLPTTTCGITATGGALINATVWAINVNTGQGVWNYSIPQPYRGGVTTTGDLVIATTVDGYMTILNAATGALVDRMLIGGPLEIQPTVATDTNGTVLLIQPVGSDNLGIFAAVVPGDVIALKVPATSVTPPPPSTGISPTLFYGVVAVAVVLAIVSGISISMARRKPAPVKTT